ncbi:MAG: helix-turn-helix transcriptional regulator [Mogibacterium sp.]|nr:helix-turn-helix transcriptional regulator [Mogibacterium sp.]
MRDSAADKILTAAAKLFAANGYAGTTTRMIVAEAGSSLSAIHAHFGSKEGVYRAVMENTAEMFYQLNASFFKGIQTLEEEGVLSGSIAWDQLVLLTGHVVEWIYNPKYRSEILLMNQQMIGLGDISLDLPDSFYELFRQFEKLFHAYTGNSQGDWAIKLAFYTVTSAFDAANYPHVLMKLLGKSLIDEEDIALMKINLKSYLLTNLRVQLDLRS